MIQDEAHAARTILHAHIEAERAADVETTMSLVSDSPVWLMHPVFEVSGRAAVRELYRRTLPAPGHQALGDETIRAIDDPDVATWSGRLCVIEYPRRPDRYPLHRSLVLVVGLDDHSVSAERVYTLDPGAASMLVEFFGPDFAEVPGVRRLGTPPGRP